MIKIWNCSSIWPGKVNFIDSNNVILGYNLSSSCCENAFWRITLTADGSTESIHEGSENSQFELVLEEYNFDPDFYAMIDPEADNGHAVFKLNSLAWRTDEPDLYLHLENHQNGYYSHGFTFRGNKIISEYI